MSSVLLEELYIHNFKSFYNSKFKFNKLNCLIAPNNSGKSNLMDALKFLNRLLYENTVKAIALFGFDELRNFHYDEKEVNLDAKFKIKNRVLINDELIEYDSKLLFVFKLDLEKNIVNIDVCLDGKIKSITIDKADMKNSLSLRKFDNLEDEVESYDIYLEELKKKVFRPFKFTYNNKTLNYGISETGRYKGTEKIVQKLLGLSISNKSESLSSPLDYKNIFNKTSLFSAHYFHAHDIKRKSERLGEDRLSEDGTNLVEFLESLDEEVFEDISTSIIGEVELIEEIRLDKDGVVPNLEFIENINGVEHTVRLKNVSDGTIHFISIMSALYGNDKSMAVMVEEPERHIHMKVLSTILETMRNDDKQIFFTTHSTELLNELELKEIVFMYRDFDGNSKSIRAEAIDNINTIMKRYKHDLVSIIQMGVLDDIGDAL